MPLRVFAPLWGVLLAACAHGYSVPSSHGAGAGFDGRWEVRTTGSPGTGLLAAEAAARDLAGYVATRLPLPQDIVVKLEGCGHAEVAWYPSLSEVVLCHEMVARVTELLEIPSDRCVADTMLRRVFRFILAHEIGHAVQDLYPVALDQSGEILADEFAALFLLADPRFDADLISAASLVQRLAELPDLLESARQERVARYTMLRCLWAGAQPEAQGACRDTYHRRRQYWAEQAPQLAQALTKESR